MITVTIPGWRTLELTKLVLDYNGTLAKDGGLEPELVQLVNRLAEKMQVYVVTADTFGTVRQACRHMAADLYTLTGQNGTQEKDDFVQSIGPEQVVAIGNGYNDHLMLRRAALGIAVLGPEGAAQEAILNADVCTGSIGDALELLLYPQRLIATLRR